MRVRRQTTDDRRQMELRDHSSFPPYRDKWSLEERCGGIRHSAVGILNSRSGSALIVVLWVIMMLSLLIGSLAFDAHIQARITSYYRKRTKAEYLAKSGIKITEMLLRRCQRIEKNTGDQKSEDEDAWWFEGAKRLSEGMAIRGLTHQLGDGTISLYIIPEPGRRNVNRIKEDDWERILGESNIPEEMWPELIDSFYDWTDADETPRTDGAETEDYYVTMDPSYEAKNGPLDTVGELLLIKGFDKTILYGGEVNLGYENEASVRINGIAGLLTTYGDGKVNVNAAGSNVLMTLPDVDSVVAGAIIEDREGWLDEKGKKEDHSFENVDDLFSKIPDLPISIKPYITTRSTIYRVTSIGTVNNVQKKVWCILTYDNKNVTILRWREEG